MNTKTHKENIMNNNKYEPENGNEWFREYLKQRLINTPCNECGIIAKKGESLITTFAGEAFIFHRTCLVKLERERESREEQQ